MTRRPASAILVLTLMALVASALPALAQSTQPHPRTYRLEGASNLQRGCFPPCMCPIMITDGMRGVFRLTPTGTVGGFETFAVTHVKWIVVISSQLPVLRVTGAGTYRISRDTAEPLHQLELDLAIGSDPVQRFDSGLVPVTTDLPRIDIDVSLHGGYCYDTLLELHARPLLELRPSRTGVSWDPIPDATGTDLMRGDLNAIRISRGDFGPAAIGCLANDTAATSVLDPTAPLPGQGFWYLAREVMSAAPETYDATDAGQVASRDPSLQTSSAACP